MHWTVSDVPVCVLTCGDTVTVEDSPSIIEISPGNGGYTVAAIEQARSIVFEPPDYDGDYEVTPKVTAQLLATNNRAMRSDVEIRGIPYASVSNPSGGMTATIG